MVAYENDHYAVEIGAYPGDELDSYLVRNKEFGVVEYCHSVLYFAKMWADSYSDLLSGKQVTPDMINNLPDVP